MTRHGPSRLRRLLDVTVAAVGLVFLLPVLLVVAVVVRLSLGSPVLFRQVRAGRRGRRFTIYKFRSMRNPEGPVELGADDELRLTRVGRFLRSTSLDELPELMNVIKGDMALVGPRPLPPEYLERYTPEQARRLEVTPGVTGWAQVKGRNTLAWEDRFALDVFYVDHQSLWFDLRILAMTVVKVLRRDGISAEGHATSPVFRGTTVAPRSRANELP
jgi:lipopolysaccharide/colanic/teichoic acid biosynthesis glycosyltransferase